MIIDEKTLKIDISIYTCNITHIYTLLSKFYDFPICIL